MPMKFAGRTYHLKTTYKNGKPKVEVVVSKAAKIIKFVIRKGKKVPVVHVGTQYKPIA